MTQRPTATKERTKQQTSSSTPAYQRCPPTPADPTGLYRPKEITKPKLRGKQTNKGKANTQKAANKQRKTGPADPQRGPTHSFQGPGPTGGA